MSKSGSGGGGSGAGNGNGGRGSSSGSGRSGSIGGGNGPAAAAHKAAAGAGGNGKPPKPASASSSSATKGAGKGKHSGGGSRRKGGSAADGDDTGSGSVAGGVSPSPPSTPQLDAKTPPFAPSPDPTKSSARAGARVAPFGLDGGKAKGDDADDGDAEDGGAGAPGGAGGWNDGAGNARDEKGGGEGGAEGKTSNAVSANTSPALPPANPAGGAVAAASATKSDKPAAAAASTPTGAATPATPAALAALARPKRKNVNVATVALLYDPPVEGCELKPYVLLKDMEQQRTVGLKSGDELEYKWFRGVKRICSLPKCKNGATLQCLSCVKANGPSNVSYFCSETCLRLAWSTHRLLHQKSQSNAAQPDVKSGADAWNHDDEEYSGKTPDSAQAVSARYPPLISNQWTEASRNRVYSPVTDDVGRCVRLECTYKPGGSVSAAGASSGAAAAAAGGGSGAAPVNPHADLQEDVLELAGMAVEPSIGFTLRVTPGAAAAHAKRVAEEKAVTPSTPGTPHIPQHTPLQYYNPNIFTNMSNNLWWYDDNDCGGSTGMTPNAWHFMETSPVLPAPTSPPPRHMFWKQGQPSQSTTSFKCLCYNVLAQIYATRQLYPYCAVWALAWNYRKNILLREILSHNADIINLQEVQANHFDKFFQPALSKAGYDGIFKRKNRETVRENPNAIDGCAIFYKRERFALMEQYGIEFNEAARQQTSDRKALRRLLKGNIALVVVLEELGGNDSSRAPRRQRKRRLCVANTHIFWDPEYADVKLWQTWILLQELEKLVLHRNLPLLLCGDFNSMTDSAVYELLANERVSSKHSVFKNDPCQLLPTPNEIASRLPLVSAYSAIGEPKYTNYTGHFVGVLDYIFYSKAHLSCLGCLEVDSEQQLKRETALPNAQYSSDHISLVSELEWLHDA